MFQRLSHIMLYVRDLDRAVIWYREKLGFTPNFVSPGSYASLRHDGMGCRLDLHPTEADFKDVGYGPMPYFVAEDFDQAIVTLQDRNVKVGAPRREGGSPRFVTFWDSEGNALGIEERR